MNVTRRWVDDYVRPNLDPCRMPEIGQTIIASSGRLIEAGRVIETRTASVVCQRADGSCFIVLRRDCYTPKKESTTRAAEHQGEIFAA